MECLRCREEAGFGFGNDLGGLISALVLMTRYGKLEYAVQALAQALAKVWRRCYQGGKVRGGWRRLLELLF